MWLYEKLFSLLRKIDISDTGLTQIVANFVQCHSGNTSRQLMVVDWITDDSSDQLSVDNYKQNSEV